MKLFTRKILPFKASRRCSQNSAAIPDAQTS